MSFAALATVALSRLAAADPLNCTYRSPSTPVQLAITDGYKHAQSIGTRVRTCDKSVCSDAAGAHKFIDCPSDLLIGGTTTVLVDNDLVCVCGRCGPARAHSANGH